MTGIFLFSASTLNDLIFLQTGTLCSKILADTFYSSC